MAKVGSATLARAMESARTTAATFASSQTNFDPQELTSVAYLAIAQAVDSWDPAKGTFETWCRLLTRQRILDHLRSLDPMSRLQRSSRKKFEANDNSLLFNAPQPRRRIVYLEDVGQDPSYLESQELRVLGKQLRVDLTKIEMQVIFGRIWVGETIPEVAERLGKSESAVSYHWRAAMRKMRTKLNGERSYVP